MNRFIALVLGIVLTVAVASADDKPQGMIGVQLKLNEGKIIILEPFRDGPADKAGLKAGDIVLKINDFKVKEEAEQDDLTDTVQEVTKQKPGEKVNVLIKRDGKEMKFEVLVGNRAEILKKLEKDKNKDKE